MTQHLADTLSIYTEHMIDFNHELEFHLLNGIVLSDDKTFLLAIPCDSNHPGIPMEINKANCIFFSMLAGNMKHAMDLYKDRFDFVAFKRQFKNSNHVRFYSYSQFHKKLK